MKLFCLAFLFLVCCQRQTYKKHYIAIEIDGKREKLDEIRDVKFSGDTLPALIYCYYLNDRGEVVKDGEECVYMGAWPQRRNFYRDGSIIETLRITIIP